MISIGRHLAKEVLADESRRSVFVALDEPVVIVVIAEALEGPVQVFEGGVGVDPEKLFFERSPEPLDAAVLPSGPRTKEGLESIPRKGSSAWKALETN